jgi:hypothetical protein
MLPPICLLLVLQVLLLVSRRLMPCWSPCWRSSHSSSSSSSTNNRWLVLLGQQMTCWLA